MSKLSRIVSSEFYSHHCEAATCDAYTGPLLTHFQPLSAEDISKLVKVSPTKSCLLDPIPTSLLKQHTDDLLPLITAIVNTSLSSGVVPLQFKHAAVTPLLKKHGLDPNDLKNFRPVSNLPFVSKILEKVQTAILFGPFAKPNLTLFRAKLGLG